MQKAKLQLLRMRDLVQLQFHTDETLVSQRGTTNSKAHKKKEPSL